MNLRNAGDYHIGLDLGTGSVGWCVVDDDGELLHIKGKPTWGSRLFPNAETAADTRVKRGQRRRYDRRRERLDCLQGVFDDEMAKVDPEFFCRMRQSSLLAEDRDPDHPTDYHHPFFNATDFTESDYYAKFHTIWHLRKHLAETGERADIRLVYLALHNIVKYRGNFLHEGEDGLTAANANADDAALELAMALEEYVAGAARARDVELSVEVDIEALRAALDGRGLSRASRAEKIKDAISLSDASAAKSLGLKDMPKTVGRACVGYKVELANIFVGLDKQEGTNLELSSDEKTEEFSSLCPDDALPVFEALQAAYSANVLSELLRGKTSLSAAMVASYDQHKSDLKLLKGLVRDHLGKKAYNELFRGPRDARGDYDINKLPPKSYTAYIAGESLANKKGCTQEDLVKHIRELCDGSDGIKADPRFAQIEGRLYADDGEFLSKQKTRANGAIPYQLHLEELDRIIDGQGRYYPFLEENRELLEKLVSSRIPYYVGPLNAGRDPDEGGYPQNPIDDGKRKFAWSVRREGKEHAEAHPWNVAEVIDTDATAERFINRMTGTCTYLWGEPVLPRHSLLYEEFCVLNELNGARWGEPGGDARRFDAADRAALVEELFKARKGVSHRAVSKWLERRNGTIGAEVSGTQGETGFESKLSSYVDFCKILGVERLEDPDCPLTTGEIEEVIMWSTVFEDRDILKRRLEQTFGPDSSGKLTEDQIAKIVKKRYQGWGRLSRKLLCGLRTDTTWGPKSIMDILREGDPTTGHHSQAMILMEILHEDSFGFEELIDAENKKRLGEDGGGLSVSDMPGSPALRRSVNQALRIVDELVGIAGHDPSSIVIETTRDDDERKKGTRTTRRSDALEAALKAFKKDVGTLDDELFGELRERRDALGDDRLMLYFAQAGKCMYSGDSLDINNLSTYHIDHIIPQAYIKDDSLDNRVLVKQKLNERKLDSLLLPSDIVRRQRRWWGQLHDAGLISDKKYRNLTRDRVSDNALKGFINRQLVETSQIVKFTRQMLEQRYAGTEVVSLRASLSSGLRERCGFVKCREVNDFHHAHDAFLACQLSRFLAFRYPKWRDGFDLAIVRKYVEGLARQGRQTGRLRPGNAGFIVDSFLRDGFDRETGEIFKDAWDGKGEVARIGHALDMRQCFISRMTEEQTGAFWDETLFSPRDEKHNAESLVPQKGFGTDRALDPKKYGGFDKPQRAYFFIFCARDAKGRVKHFFEGVPIHLASRAACSPEALEAFAEGIAREAGCSGAKVLRARVPLRQKLVLDGTEFWLYGRSDQRNEIRAATQWAPDRRLTDLARRVLDGRGNVEAGEFEELYDAIAEGVGRTCPRLAHALALDERRDAFCGLASDEKKSADDKKREVIKNLLMALKGDSRGCNLTLIGGKSETGQMKVALGSKIPEITWVDQSVTGIFERRATGEEGSHGL